MAHAQDTLSSILVLHDAGLDPYPFLARLTSTPESDDSLRESVPWTIDNKYYTAKVDFRPHELGTLPQAHPVVMYLFKGLPSNPLPPSLTRLAVLDPPPDISLAIRVKSQGAYGPLDEDEEERFDEIGMEVVDEMGDADDDDERPLDPLDTVRQTLMTHMWPNMRRKAAPGPRRDIPRPDIAADGDESDENEASQFPVSFSSRAVPVANAPGPSSDFPTPEPETPDEEEDLSFGGYAPLRADGDDFGAFESGRGPAASEYARLDSWLDDDGAEDENGVEGEGQGEINDEARRHIPPTGNGQSFGFHQFDDVPDLVPDMGDTPRFDDNFGPMPGLHSGRLALPLDPTPLLLRLQQVRAELSEVEDLDERHRRAEEEVTRVMASLGFDGGDWDDSLDGVDEGVDMATIARLDRLQRDDDEEADLAALQRELAM